MVRYSFPVGLFHPLPYAGLSRRTAWHQLGCRTNWAANWAGNFMHSLISFRIRAVETALYENSGDAGGWPRILEFWPRILAPNLAPNFWPRISFSGDGPVLLGVAGDLLDPDLLA